MTSNGEHSAKQSVSFFEKFYSFIHNCFSNICYRVGGNSQQWRCWFPEVYLFWGASASLPPTPRSGEVTQELETAPPAFGTLISLFLWGPAFPDSVPSLAHSTGLLFFNQEDR